jgi:adenylyl-sulfate kinase
VHLRNSTVNLELVKVLCIGSVPSAFFGAWFISLQPRGEELDGFLKTALGLALITAAAGLVARAVFQMWQNRLPLGEGAARPTRPEVRLRPIPTIVLGAVAGFIVGITSVGSGSIIIVSLLLIYPGLKASALVGTDLTQAIPLVGAAALGHLLFGSFNLDITSSLLLGAIPGAFIGAQISSRAPGGIIRRILAVLLLASGLRLLGVSTEMVLVVAVAALFLGSLAWIAIRRMVRGPRPERAERPNRDKKGTKPPEVGGAGTRGAVVFMTGLSGAGKSTIAEALQADLEAAGRPATILDGDVLRALDATSLGFDRASRERQVQRAAEMAAENAAGGKVVIAALIAPFDGARKRARAIVEPVAPFLLTWIRTPLEVAEERDPKGLYKKVRAGEIGEFTGISSPFDEPEDAELVIDTTSTSVPEAVARIRAAIEAALT